MAPRFCDPVKAFVRRCRTWAETWYFSRWAALLGAVLLASVTGVTFGFSVFRSAAEDDLGYDPDDMRYAASVGVSGRYTGVFAAGLVGAALGPRLCVLLGLALVASALGSLSAYASPEGSRATVGAVAAAYFFGMIGYGFWVTALTSSAVKNFPATATGAVAGIAKGFVSLSPAFLSVLFAMFHSDDNRRPDDDSAHDFLETQVALTVVLALAAFVLVNVVPPSTVPFTFETSQNLSISLGPWFAHLAALLAMLLILDTCAEYGPDPGTDAGAGLLLVMLLALVFLPLYYGPLLRKRSDDGELDFDALFFGRLAEMNSLGLKAKKKKKKKPRSAAPKELPAGAEQKEAASDDGEKEGDQAAAAAPGPPPPLSPTTARSDAASLTKRVVWSIKRFFDPYDPIENDASPRAGGAPRDGGNGRGSGATAAGAASFPNFGVPKVNFGQVNFGGSFMDFVPDWVDKRPFGADGALRDVAFWLLFLIQVLGEATGILMIRHMNQIIRAARSDPGAQAPRWLDTIVGLSVAAGAACCGYASDTALQRGYPRTRFQATVLLVLALASFLAATSAPVLLELCFVASALCYGAVSAVGTALCADLFGRERFGENFAFLQLATALSSLTFATSTIRIGFPDADISVDLAAEAEPALFEEEAAYCGGAGCFGPALAIGGVVCVIGAILSAHVLPNTATGLRRVA
eukprot:CAMPEP_0118869758 /NCGR_PEP_ID=MMETSP1163-20130328/12991_1 /TAXON_ID=124430 /ORGANISM="Phaeomonas parva, Strain CCMP2877" /LENGTH=691 /DNA_ID=CAMNT_0006804687 /DNA_START=49 /DNA_END=2120 /DNA_ORIENTATION=-